MRRFELVEGTSSKFWEVEVDGCDVTVRFGRIGTSGQTKTKTFGSDAAAKREHDTLVKEKTSKGYSEVGVAAGAKLGAAPVRATAAAPAPANMPASANATAPAPAAAHATSEPTPAIVQPPAAPAVAIAWPDGGFDWNDEWRKKLPVVRGIHAPAQIDGKALLAKYDALVIVTAGTTLGMMIANVPAVLLGDRVLTRVPVQWGHRIAAVTFAAIGVAVLLR
jgi:predicted DNA-binding WGR domain protein